MTDRYQQGVLDTSVVIDIHTIPDLATGHRSRAIRIERLQLVEANYHSPLPFDAQCARRYGSLFTRNADDFAGLESAVLVVPV